jgi:hypothetical protein
LSIGLSSIISYLSVLLSGSIHHHKLKQKDVVPAPEGFWY